jgi:T4 RnlA family RNA ligase
MTAPDTLFTQLMELTETNPAFYFKDFWAEIPDRFYRIFNYRLASYSDFCLPGALECRGSMFLVDSEGGYIDLVCRPPKKFFNLNENPFTMGLDLTDLYMVMKKDDGSLMSTYIHSSGELRLKSKGSINSEQAIDAMAFLKTQPALLADLKYLAARDFTVNLEWTAPWNRIVVGYQKPGLIGLSLVCNMTGRAFYRDFLEDEGLAGLMDAWVEDFQYEGDLEHCIKNLVGEEGVVAITSTGVPFKLKGDWYLALHRNKDSVSNSKSLIELVLMEKTDDLKSMFVGDDLVLNKIMAYEKSIGSVYNSVLVMVQSFHEQHKTATKKDYAIAAKSFWDAREHPWGFHAQMGCNVGKDYEALVKSMIIRNADNFILKEFERNVES